MPVGFDRKGAVYCDKPAPVDAVVASVLMAGVAMLRRELPGAPPPA